MKRTILFLLAVLVLSVSLFGCGDREHFNQSSEGGILLSSGALSEESDISSETTTTTENLNGGKSATTNGSNSGKNNLKSNSTTSNAGSSNGSSSSSSSSNVGKEELPVIKVTNPTKDISYIRPSMSSVTLAENSSGIYENKYAKIDTTSANKGLIKVLYKDPYATSVVVQFDRGERISKQTYDLSLSDSQVFKLPFENGSYSISVFSIIDSVESYKLIVDIAKIQIDGVLDWDYLSPSEEKKVLTQIGNTGTYQNTYVKVDISKANSNGYIDITYIEPYAVSAGYYLEKDPNDTGMVKGYQRNYYKVDVKSTRRVNVTHGSGRYMLYVSSNIEGGTSLKAEFAFNVSLSNQFAPFLITTAEIIYNSDMAFIKKASELSVNCSSDSEKISKIYNWLTGYITYGENPNFSYEIADYKCDLNYIYNQKRGVCYDYAAILTAMLRSQNIPCKMVMGYYSSGVNGHMWVEVYANTALKNNQINLKAATWTRLDPTLTSLWVDDVAAREHMSTDSNYVRHAYY